MSAIRSKIASSAKRDHFACVNFEIVDDPADVGTGRVGDIEPRHRSAQRPDALGAIAFELFVGDVLAAGNLPASLIEIGFCP